MLLPHSIVTSMPRLLLRTISGECYISDLITEATLTMVLKFYDFHWKVLWFCSCLRKMKNAMLFLLKCREVSFNEINLKVSYNMLASVCTFIYLFFLNQQIPISFSSAQKRQCSRGFTFANNVYCVGCLVSQNSL